MLCYVNRTKVVIHVHRNIVYVAVLYVTSNCLSSGLFVVGGEYPYCRVFVVRRAQAARLHLRSLLTELESVASADTAVTSDDSDVRKVQQEIAAVYIFPLMKLELIHYYCNFLLNWPIFMPSRQQAVPAALCFHVVRPSVRTSVLPLCCF